MPELSGHCIACGVALRGAGYGFDTLSDSWRHGNMEVMEIWKDVNEIHHLLVYPSVSVGSSNSAPGSVPSGIGVLRRASCLALFFITESIG